MLQNRQNILITTAHSFHSGAMCYQFFFKQTIFYYLPRLLSLLLLVCRKLQIHTCIFFLIVSITYMYYIPQLKSSQVISGKCQDNRLPFDSSQDGKGLHLNFCFRFQEKVLLTQVCVSTKIKQRCQHIKFKTHIQTEQHHQAPTQV